MKYLGQVSLPTLSNQQGQNIQARHKDWIRWVRSKMARVDDETRRRAIEYVRKTIFEYGRGILSKAVESVVRAKSLVPTRVRISAMMNIHYMTD
jgi:hypothetical protein